MKLTLFLLSLFTIFTSIASIQSTSNSDLPKESDSEDDQGNKEDPNYVHAPEVLHTIPPDCRVDNDNGKYLRQRENLKVVVPITYHNGPIMTSITVNIIWYNYLALNVWTAADQSIIRTFLSDLNNSPWWAINNGYTNAAAGRVPTTYTLNPTEVTITGAKLTLTTADIKAAVAQATAAGAPMAPPNPNAIYLVLTAGGVGQKDGLQGFCTHYCGWHTYGTVNLVANIKFSFVGNPTKCLASCAGQSLKSPNGSPGVDGAISVIAHELAETASDPVLNAWYDASGMENADKCAWTWGATYLAPNGAKANVQINTRNYLIQQNWKPATSTCGLA